MEASALSHASRRGLLARRSPLLKLQSDDRLVALVRARNDSAFEVLWDRYRTRLLAYCRSIVRSSEDAEDVLQEVFVNAHAAMLADEREIQVRPWLYRIARNRSLNHLRKPVADGQDSMDLHYHAHGETAHDDAERRENVRQLVADVKTLPETQRTALILREIDNLSYDEIAQTMETTIPSVKSLLVRARISLAEASESRLLTCDEVRVHLAAAAEGIAKVSGATRRHMRECEPCATFRKQLRADEKALAALSPIGLVAIAHALAAKLFGGAGGSGAAGMTGASAGAGAGAGAGAAGTAAATSGAIATGTAGGGALVGGLGGAVGVKAAATAATAAIITAGAVEVSRKPQTTPSTTPVPVVRAHEAPQPKVAKKVKAAAVVPARDEPLASAKSAAVVAEEPAAANALADPVAPESNDPATEPAQEPATAVVAPPASAEAENPDPAPLVDSSEGREPAAGHGHGDAEAPTATGDPVAPEQPEPTATPEAATTNSAAAVDSSATPAPAPASPPASP